MPQRISYTGLIPAVFTPLDEQRELALERIDAYAEHLARAHVAAAFICGTTGEGPSLSTSERLAVAERWREVVGETLPVIVHVGHASLSEARALAAHAQRIGASAISATAPYFFKPAVVPLVDWCAQVAAAAPELPFYYYHIPSMTGVNIPASTFLTEAQAKIPTLAGVKFTYEDLLDVQNAMRYAAGRWQVLFGRDEILLAALALGCTGAVGSTYNFAAPIYHRIIEAYTRGDLDAARLHQQRAAQFIQAMGRHGGLVAAKAIMRLIGMDCGPTRLPLGSLSPQQEAALRDDLAMIGFFDWIK